MCYFKALVPYYKHMYDFTHAFVNTTCTQIEEAHYTIIFSVDHQFYLSCSILVVNRLCSVTNTKYKYNITCHYL